MNKLLTITSLLLCGALNALAESPKKTLIDFSKVKESDWQAVNDNVMGGISAGQFKINHQIGLFRGSLSLENNGGFASIRHILKSNPMKEETHIQLRVKGDGRTYQFRVRDNSRFDTVAFKYDFKTTPDQWLDILIPIASMTSTFRGRHLPNYTAPKASEIKQLGFLIADKTAGAFQLEISSISYLNLVDSESP